MQVKVEDVTSVKKVLHIEIPETDVTREVESAYQKLKKTAKLKGFRPGKAPRSVLERYFKKDVSADVTTQIIQESLVEAIKETGLNVIGTPKVEPTELEAGKPYEYQAEVEIQPKIDDIDYKGLKLKKNRYTVTESDLEPQLKMIQQSLSQQKTLEEDRPLQQGDYALIDYEGFKDGKPYEETQKTENFTLKVGEGKILKEFDEALIGMKAGESKEVHIDFPESYPNASLSGRGIDFNVKLNEIREQVLPDIDDEMAKDLGKYDSLEALKSDIRKNLTQGYEKRTEQELNEQIFSELIERTDFEVPDLMVDYELESIIAEAEKSFDNRGQSMEDFGITKEGLAEKYRDTAVKQVRRQLILGKLIEQENISLTDEEIESGYQDMADNFNQPVDGIKNFYRQNADRLEYFKHALLEKKAIRLILENSEIEEIEPSASPETEAASETGASTEA